MTTVKEIEKLLLDFFEQDEWKVQQWLSTENMNLGGSKPITLINAGREDKVLAFVKSSVEGY